MVQPGWIAARTPPGFHHRLFTPLQPATAGTPASDRRRCPKRREPRIVVLRRRPHVANPRKSPAKTLPSRTARRPPSFPSVEFLPVKTELSNDSAARPRAAQNRGPGAPRRGFLPPPNGAADPRSGASFPRYNPTRPPGRGSVWQSTWFGIRGSQVQILPPRRGPSPRRFRQTGSPRRVRQTGSADGFRQTGFGPEAATASGCFGRIFPRPFPPRKRAVTSALTHGSKRVYSGALAGDGSSRRVPFFLLLLLDIPKSGVMKLARMFALSAPAHSLVSVRSEPYFAGFLPLDPVAHILAARLAGAGTRRFALSYRRWE